MRAALGKMGGKAYSYTESYADSGNSNFYILNRGYMDSPDNGISLKIRILGWLG